MKKYKVLTNFRDEEKPGVFHRAGSVIELTDERASKVLSVGKFVEVIEEAAAETHGEPIKKKKSAKKTKK